jgi:osmoprotectant transport system permease protein
VRPDPLRAVLALAAWGGVLAPFLSVARNRLVVGAPVPVWAVPGGAALAGVALALGVLAASALWRGRAGAALAAGAGLALPALCLAAAGAGAIGLIAGLPPTARVGLGPGFWMPVLAGTLAGLDGLGRLRPARWQAGAAQALALAGPVALALSGRLRALAIAREYAVHRAEFAAALGRHLELTGLTVALALAIGVPLGIAALDRPRLRGVAFGLLNVAQTVPSVALFGLLIAPLAALGLSGIGLVPALVALVLYALLPVVRNTVAGLAGVEAAVLEAASGVGFSPRQVLWRVRLPLAAPALLAGLRIVTVQTVGLAVVAALIGAGGLGDFVFQGLGQAAPDLVLLGALPAIALALAADRLLRA